MWFVATLDYIELPEFLTVFIGMKVGGHQEKEAKKRKRWRIGERRPLNFLRFHMVVLLGLVSPNTIAIQLFTRLSIHLPLNYWIIQENLKRTKKQPNWPQIVEKINNKTKNVCLL